MPTPAVYVLAIVGTVAAGLAFKEFVYEPHIAPKIEQWAEEFLERRRRSRFRTLNRPYEVPFFDTDGLDDKRSDSTAANDLDDKKTFELEQLVTKEVHEWRKEVERSTLRQRKPQLHSSIDDDSGDARHLRPAVTHLPLEHALLAGTANARAVRS
ncbi:hypothetical protein BD626DRAFT_534075 [Schizophyllum amplum]|uniref:Uncharacterized protein n=1 Tax=Schizophyllum amplum TaxID=97359 RepID=A0A550CSJ4_9AGAR|nr:hypothetical protein BD626DRAFT_534075 [Auriculariopsis ampla]